MTVGLLAVAADFCNKLGAGTWRLKATAGYPSVSNIKFHVKPFFERLLLFIMARAIFDYCSLGFMSFAASTRCSYAPNISKLLFARCIFIMRAFTHLILLIACTPCCRRPPVARLAAPASRCRSHPRCGPAHGRAAAWHRSSCQTSGPARCRGTCRCRGVPPLGAAAGARKAAGEYTLLL